MAGQSGLLEPAHIVQACETEDMAELANVATMCDMAELADLTATGDVAGGGDLWRRPTAASPVALTPADDSAERKNRRTS